MGYTIRCKVCLGKGVEAKYFGETGFSAYFRMKFHTDTLRRKTKESVLYKHQLEHHPGMTLTQDDFLFRVTGRFGRAITRQCQEGIFINHALDAVKQGDRVVLMNSKSEFLQPGVVERSFKGVLATC